MPAFLLVCGTELYLHLNLYLPTFRKKNTPHLTQWLSPVVPYFSLSFHTVLGSHVVYYFAILSLFSFLPRAICCDTVVNLKTLRESGPVGWQIQRSPVCPHPSCLQHGDIQHSPPLLLLLFSSWSSHYHQKLSSQAAQHSYKFTGPE